MLVQSTYRQRIPSSPEPRVNTGTPKVSKHVRKAKCGREANHFLKYEQDAYERQKDRQTDRLTDRGREGGKKDGNTWDFLEAKSTTLQMKGDIRVCAVERVGKS